MNIELTAKHLSLTQTMITRVKKFKLSLQKLLRTIPKVDDHITIRIQKTPDKKESYHGTVTIPLPHHVLRLESEAVEPQHLLTTLIDKTKRAIRQYKGKYIPSHSDYANHSTIRK